MLQRRHTFFLLLLDYTFNMAPARRITAEIDAFIEQEYRYGRSAPQIRDLIELDFGVDISLQHLRRRVLPRLGLARFGRNQSATPHIIIAYLLILTEMPHHNAAPPLVTHLLRTAFGLNVTRRFVRRLNHIILPQLVERRRHGRLRRRTYRSLGSNYTWHIDGYDKLSPFGLPVHSGICGFSRNLIWLRACATNHNPHHIAHLFIEAVATHGVPHTVRFDMGTENVCVRQAQNMLCEGLPRFSATPPVLVGSSNHNERIERFWGTLRRQLIQSWMDYFVDLEDDGFFIRWDRTDRQLSHFAFFNILQMNLDAFMIFHNNHRIRSQRNADIVTGVVSIMYRHPHLYGGQECAFPADPLKLAIAGDNFTEVVGPNEHFTQLCHLLCIGVDINPNPATLDEADQLFRSLHPLLHQLLDD